MALTQPGARYRNQSEIQRRDKILGEAIDDIVSQVQAVAIQTNAPVTGSQSAPAAPASLAVTASSGYALATISNNNAPTGLSYVVQYSTSPNFANPIPVDLGSQLVLHQYLQGLTLYFRCAAKYATSALSPWTYFGTASSPTSITF